jgi:hypothetical protein
MSLDVLRNACFSYAHSIISYGITFWGNLSYGEEIFKIQKRIIRIIMNSSRKCLLLATISGFNPYPANVKNRVSS